MITKFFKKIEKNKLTISVLLILLIISAIAHGYNMFHFPYFEDDEGTYMSQAWSFITSGQLAPYTYWYDHAPLGWIFISFWVKLVGGFFTFGTSIQTGRVFMLMLHLLSTLFLYIIAKRLSKSTVVASIATLIFSISPLAIYFQRRVLLDNIMTFWVLLTLLVLTVKKLKLRHIYVGAITMGVACLTKENAIFFIPGFIVLIAQRSHNYHRSFAIVKWLTVVVLFIAMYIVYALMKGEFFPVGSLLGGTSPHVSLWTTIQFQVSRSGGSIFDFKHSLFWLNMRIWLAGDKLLILGGMVSTLFIGLISIKKKLYIPYVLFSLFLSYYLTHGVVNDFYIIPLIPFFTLLIGLSMFEIGNFFQRIFKNHSVYFITSFVFILLVGTYYAKYGYQSRGFNIYSSDQTIAQIEALTWIRTNIPTNSIFSMDNYGYVDLHSLQNPSKLAYPYAEYYWKIDEDPEIKYGILDNNPASINVLAITPQADVDGIKSGALPILSTVINHSAPIKTFWSAGWGVTLWQPRYPNQILSITWNSYKNNFISKNGRTLDPANKNNTTSEAQAYLLLRAVWENDKTQFETSWTWTKKSTQLSNHLFGWEWINNKNSLVDGGTASDADEDIALSLAMAAKKWNNSAYLNESKDIIQAIWDNEVKLQNGKPYLVAGNWAKNRNNVIIDPSYLAPYEYRVFAQIDPKHQWMKLVDSSYEVFNGCSSSVLDKEMSVNLVPDWCAITATGKFTTSTEPNLTSTSYSFDAFRSTWRIALDYEWNKELRAKKFLENSTFIRNQWKQKGKILVGYTHDGKPWENYESAVAYGANIGNFVVTDPETANVIYQKELLNKFYENSKSAYWEDPNNYYTQNWAWFGTALYSNNLPNFW